MAETLPKNPGPLLKIIRSRDLQVLALILAFVLPVTLPMLKSFFSFDDLQNLNYYLQDPWESILSNLLLFTSHRRPVGALLYVPLYQMFGMNPLPLYLAGFLIFHCNLVLLYFLIKRLTGRRGPAVITVGLSALYPHVHNVLFNFGAIYELLAFSSLVLALHAYLSFRENGRKSFYFLTLLVFWIGLNAKETTAVLPALLTVYELLYHPVRSWLTAARKWFPWHLPLWGIASAYTLAKTLGAEAMWRSNPAYQLQFDWTFWNNLVRYAYEIGYGEHEVTGGTVTLILTAAIVAGILLRNPHMLFGLAYALLTLLPVLLLPRVWGLFLYIPLPGLALSVAALLDQVGRWLWQRLQEGIQRYRQLQSLAPLLPRVKQALSLVLALVFLRSILVYSAPRVRYAREANYFARGRPWRAFSEQLYRLYPEMEEKAVLAFKDPPFDPESFDRWCLNFLVWLKFKDWDITILRIPEDTQRMERQLRAKLPVHYFVWEDGTLREKKPTDL